MNSAPLIPCQPVAPSHGARSIRFKLLLGINTTFALGLLLLMMLEYHTQLNGHVHERHTALLTEARTLTVVLPSLRAQGSAAVHERLDAVCGRVHEAAAGGHHIAAVVGGEVFTDRMNPPDPRLLPALWAAAGAADWQADFGQHRVLVGADQIGDTRVLVAEHVGPIVQAVRGQLLAQSAGTFLLGVLVTVSVNVILTQLVNRPLERLLKAVKRITGGNLGGRVECLKSRELDFLADAINEMSTSLAAAERRRQSEMRKARRIQATLLPADANFPGLTFAHVYEPADEVGGDYFDIVRTDSGVVVCVADVSGHGVPAALSATTLKALFVNAAERSNSPAAILADINAAFSRSSLPEDFASMVVATINVEHHTVQYASAGHEPGYLLSHGHCLRDLESTGPLLGIDTSACWEEHRFTLDAGARVVLLTDGWAETRSTRGELFGRARVRAALEAGASSPYPGAVLSRQTAAWRECRGATDDATLLSIESVAFQPRPVGTTVVTNISQ